MQEDQGDGAVLKCLVENEKATSESCARETSRAVRNALSFLLAAGAHHGSLRRRRRQALPQRQAVGRAAHWGGATAPPHKCLFPFTQEKTDHNKRFSVCTHDHDTACPSVAMTWRRVELRMKELRVVA